MADSSLGVDRTAQVSSILAQVTAFEGEIVMKTQESARILSDACESVCWRPAGVESDLPSRRHGERSSCMVECRSRHALQVCSRVCNIPVWHIYLANPLSPCRAIRAAFDCGQLQLEDLWASPSCEAFWQGIVESPHDSVRALAERVKGDIRVREVSADSEEAARATNTLQLELKPRVLDPTVLLEGGKTASLTELDTDYARKVDEYRKSKKGRRTFVLE